MCSEIWHLILGKPMSGEAVASYCSSSTPITLLGSKLGAALTVALKKSNFTHKNGQVDGFVAQLPTVGSSSLSSCQISH